MPLWYWILVGVLASLGITFVAVAAPMPAQQGRFIGIPGLAMIAWGALLAAIGGIVKLVELLS